MNPKAHLLLFFFSLMINPFVFAAERVVAIVGKTSKVEKLSQAEIKAIFLGDTLYTASGLRITVNDRDRSSDIYRDFYAAVAGMSPKEVTVHWARKVFTGQAQPTARVMGSDDDAITSVKDNANTITYVYEKNVTSKVKVVYAAQ